MAKKGDADVPFQTETRGAAKRRAMEKTNPAASSTAPITQPISSSIPAGPDNPESRRRSRSPAKAITPLRSREPAPRPPRLPQAASNRSQKSPHQAALGAVDAPTPNPNREAIPAKSKKQTSKKKGVTAKTQAGERHRIIVDDVGEEAEGQPKGTGPAQVLVDMELHTGERLDSFSGAPEPKSQTLGSHSLTDWDIEHWTSEELEFINQDGLQSHPDWPEELEWRDLDLEEAVNDEFTWGNHIWTEGDASIVDSSTTNLDPQTPPSPHRAWTGRGLLAAAIASSGVLEQYPPYPVSGDTQADTLGLFMPAQDREEMADAELLSAGPTAVSAISVGDSLDIEAFVEGFSSEVLDTNLDPDLSPDMLGHDYT